jgi:hypothetical protein
MAPARRDRGECSEKRPQQPPKTARPLGLRCARMKDGQEIEKSHIVKGYEYDRGQCVTFSAEEPRMDTEFVRLSAGGRRIRTIGPSCKKRVVLVETRRLLKGADDRDPSKLQPFSCGTGSSNPSPSSGESPTNRARRVPPEGRRLSDGQLAQLWERPFDRPPRGWYRRCRRAAARALGTLRRAGGEMILASR